jgi:hypothetical protein
MEEVLSTPILRRIGQGDLYSRLNVLRTESEADLSKLLADISRDIGPTSVIERIYVQEVVSYTWDVMRYRRIKTGILNNAFRTAVERILNQTLLPSIPTSPELLVESQSALKSLSHRWLLNQEGKYSVLSALEEAGFDESAIEAEAYMLVANDLEKADRMLNSARAGRDKALRSIAKYRKSFADQLRRSSDRVLAADEVSSIANGVES